MKASSRALVRTNYHYYVDLADLASYTPPAGSVSTALCEGGTWDSDVERFEFFDGSGWISACMSTPNDSVAPIHQDTDQSIRIYGVAGGPRKISLTGWIWS